ncbi:MAG TPA: zf-HC2 domain-containing protein, partial [Candidatus Limnocylindria bacterium]|nr:zf-HC2 domain-containing protein [Candidatus Limnocylindria bacterium]
MGEQHLSDAILSGHLDRELAAIDERRARLHLAGCATCGARLASFSRLEVQLTAEPALVCASARSLVSAQLDGELSDEAGPVARTHLESCRSCQTELTFWSRLDDAIASLPVAVPSARVDQAIRDLARPRRGRSVQRGLALRGALATAVAVIAVLLTALPRSLPEVATPAIPGGSPVLVASVQQAVLNPKTNTLYVLETEQASVAARDAGTNSLITRVAVGGRPIALALDQTANAILVLDAQAKTITTIDAKTNAVVASSSVAVAGTPTSLQAANGKIVVTAVADPKPAASASGSASSTGLVAILNSTSKQLETVRTIDVAPRLIVLDPSGSLALLVGPDGSVVADASSYKQIGDKLPGGVAGAFGGDGGATIAVLSADAGGARITFGGFHAPVALLLSGKPVALTSLPSGGYGVLLDVGGRGQVLTIGADGKAIG